MIRLSCLYAEHEASEEKEANEENKAAWLCPKVQAIGGAGRRFDSRLLPSTHRSRQDTEREIAPDGRPAACVASLCYLCLLDWLMALDSYLADRY